MWGGVVIEALRVDAVDWMGIKSETLAGWIVRQDNGLHERLIACTQDHGEGVSGSAFQVGRLGGGTRPVDLHPTAPFPSAKKESNQSHVCDTELYLLECRTHLFRLNALRVTPAPTPGLSRSA